MRSISLDGVPTVRVQELPDAAPHDHIERAILGQRGWTSDLALRYDRKIGAVLRTADGAEKYVVLPWPPRDTYETVIQHHDLRSFAGDALLETTFSKRRYVLSRHEYDAGQMLQRVIYEERL